MRRPIAICLAAAAAMLGLTALAIAGDGSGIRAVSPKPLTVKTGGDRIRVEVGSFCATSTRRPTTRPGLCVDVIPPDRVPTPRLNAAPRARIELRFRDNPAIRDEIGYLTASLVRLDGRDLETLDPPLQARSIDRRKRRWELRLPPASCGARVLAIFVSFRGGGDASYLAGLRLPPDSLERYACPRGDRGPFDSRRLLGKPLAKAEAIAERHECLVRAAVVDGAPQPGTEDFRPDRIDVEVSGGVVTAIVGIG